MARHRGRVLLRTAVGVTAAGFALVAYVYLTLPDVRALAETNPESTAFMKLRAAEAAREGRSLRHRQRWVPYSRISSNLKRAVLVAEDSAFWQHEGIDLEQIRASIQAGWEQGREIRGASTITQQLAKNLYLSPSRNPLRKLRELIIARRLEAALPKARILEIYLNVIEWGDGIWGVEAASRRYFGVSAAALNREQAALLAGAIINPRLLSPARPTPRLLRRQRIILGRMGQVTLPASSRAAAERDHPVQAAVAIAEVVVPEAPPVPVDGPVADQVSEPAQDPGTPAQELEPQVDSDGALPPA